MIEAPPFRRTAIRWLLLIALSVAATAMLEWAHVPAALLLGPMAVGIVFALRGQALTVPFSGFVAAQAAIGILIAETITPVLVLRVGADLPLYFGPALATLAVSGVIAFVLMRWRLVPGAAAIWGSMPGAALAMIVMARDMGADWRLVAIMGYSRVLLVVLVATMLALVLGEPGGSAPVGGAGWFAFDPVSLAFVAVVGTLGALGAMRLRMPGGAMMGPLLLAALANAFFPIPYIVPGWLLALSFAAVGWRIGLSFTPDLMETAKRSIGPILVSGMALILFCLALAWGMTLVAPVNYLSAFLAISPGGIDSIAIIATQAHVDLSFVIAVQMARFLAVVALAPVVAKLAPRWVGDGTDKQA